jgi:hypothetical protein
MNKNRRFDHQHGAWKGVWYSMAWVTRGTKRCVYKNERIGRKVVRRYYRQGPGAELGGITADLRDVIIAIAQRERQLEEARFQEALIPLLDLCAVTDVITRATLLAAGFQQHQRGAWRKTRGRKTKD